MRICQLTFSEGLFLQPIYLDNSSTTKPCTSSISAIEDALVNNWGNPSSLHNLGLQAEHIINNTRSSISDILNCREDEIYFTGSGTEANNLAIIGAAESLKRRGNKIITTSVEHPSVLNTCEYLSQNGFEITYIKPHKDGSIHASDILNAVDSKTVLITMMLVNNETGSIFPVAEVGEALKEMKSKALLHTDCVQAFGKMNIDVDELGVDLLSASGHKIHGPKGIGFLYKRKSVNLKPIIHGGNQEKGLRSGTESVPLIAGLNGAVSELKINSNLPEIKKLHAYALEKLSQNDGIVINSPTVKNLPYILNISVLGYRSETLLHFLEAKNIYISSGSACAKGKGSHVLTEMGFSLDRTDSALRISFSRYNSLEDIDALYNALCEAQKSLRRK
ncbi:MAG: cysteine desulfurase [Clostridia bacterium]|nr:cysteine desulfurase [Clostridia bacterium]